MPSIISAGTTANTGLNLTADTSGNLVFQTNGNTTAMTIDTSQNVTYANGVSFTGVIAGNGANISSMNASNLTSGTVANARTTAASANGASTIVLRDSSGDFSAGVITANGSALTAINASNLSSGTLAAARLPAGSVLQVVSVNKVDSFSTTSTSFVDITGLSVSITPISSASKIYIVVTIPVVSGTSGSGANFALSRNGTLIGQGTSGTTQNSIAVVYMASNEFYNGTSFSILDSPATTSAITYQIRLLSSAGGTCWIGRRGSDTYGGSSSTLTAMEIAA